MPESPILDHERCCLRFAMAQEKDIVAYAESHHQVQFRFFTVEDFCLQDGIAEYIPRHAHILRIHFPAEA